MSPSREIRRACRARSRTFVERNARREPRLRHVVPQRVALFGGPVAHHLPGLVERRLVVENAGPEGRQRRNRSPSTAVGAAHFEESLEANFGEKRCQVIGPVVGGWALAFEAFEASG